MVYKNEFHTKSSNMFNKNQTYQLNSLDVGLGLLVLLANQSSIQRVQMYSAKNSPDLLPVTRAAGL